MSDRGITKKSIEKFRQKQELGKSDIESDHESDKQLINLNSLKEKFATSNASAQSSSEHWTCIAGNFEAEELESWHPICPSGPTLIRPIACMQVARSLSHHTSITLTNDQGQKAKFQFQGSLLKQFDKPSSDSSSDSSSADSSKDTVQCSNQKLTRKLIHRNYFKAIGSKKRKAVSKTHSKAVTKAVTNIPPA